MGFDVSPGWRRALIAEGGRGSGRCGHGGVWMNRAWPERDYSNTSTFSEERVRSCGSGCCSRGVDKLGEMC